MFKTNPAHTRHDTDRTQSINQVTSHAYLPAAFSAPSVDSGTSADTAALIDKIQALQDQSSVLHGAEAQVWIDRAKAAVDGKKVASHLKAGSSLAYEGATVYAFKNGKTQVAVPISNQVVGASLNVVYDPSGNLVETLEMQLTHDDKTGHAQVWRNGSLTADKILRASDLPKDLPANPTHEPTESKPTLRGFSWKKFNNCLSGAGVSSWTVALVGIACAGACVGTAGAACVPCITAAGGIGAGTVWFCFGKATS